MTLELPGHPPLTEMVHIHQNGVMREGKRNNHYLSLLQPPIRITHSGYSAKTFVWPILHVTPPIALGLTPQGLLQQRNHALAVVDARACFPPPLRPRQFRSLEDDTKVRQQNGSSNHHHNERHDAVSKHPRETKEGTVPERGSEERGEEGEKNAAGFALSYADERSSEVEYVLEVLDELEANKHASDDCK